MSLDMRELTCANCSVGHYILIVNEQVPPYRPNRKSQLTDHNSRSAVCRQTQQMVQQQQQPQRNQKTRTYSQASRSVQAMKSEYTDVYVFQAFLTLLNNFIGYLVIRAISKVTKIECKMSKPDASPSY